MLRIATRSQLELGSQCLRSLKNVVESTPATSVGTEARDAVRKINAVVNAASLTVDPLRNAVNPEAQFLCQQYDRVEKEAAARVAALTVGAMYTGPKRSDMSNAERSRYIAKHGEARYMKLPW